MVPLEFDVSELVHSAGLAKYPTMLVSVGEKIHQPPGQAMAYCQIAARDEKRASRGLVPGDCEADRDSDQRSYD